MMVKAILSRELQSKLKPILGRSCAITDLARIKEPENLRVLRALAACLYVQIPSGYIASGPIEVDFENGEARIEAEKPNKVPPVCGCEGQVYCMVCGGLVRREGS